MKTITGFEVIDHGIDGSQYFQGCGVAYTDFDHVVTGCGQNAREAWEDALEQLACDEWDVATVENSGDGQEYMSEKAEAFSVASYLAKQGEGDGESVPEDCELYYYLSIRVK